LHVDLDFATWFDLAHSGNARFLLCASGRTTDRSRPQTALANRFLVWHICLQMSEPQWYCYFDRSQDGPFTELMLMR
jgi:hypothetical protein